MGDRKVGPPMDWMAARLKEIRRKPIELAHHLGVHPPRVYEMLAGRRRLQQSELARTAEFLEWTLQTVNDLVSGKASDKVLPMVGAHNAANYELPRNIPIRETRPLDTKGEFTLSSTISDYMRRPPRLATRTDVFGVQMQSDDMSPWREAGYTVLVELNRPAREGDYALIELEPKKSNSDDANASRATIKQIVKLGPTKVRLKQYGNEHKEFDIPRSQIKTICRVIDWEELIS